MLSRDRPAAAAIRGQRADRGAHRGRGVAAMSGLCLAVAGLLALPGAAGADGIDKNAHELFAQCSSTHSRFNQGLCLGFLAGTIDTYVAVAADRRFCLPESFRLADAQAAYVAHVEADRSTTAALLHRPPWSTAWPAATRARDAGRRPPERGRQPSRH